MANRFPLVVDTSDGNKIREIPEGDSLDFSSVGVANLQSLSVSGALSGSTLSTSGAASLASLSVSGNATITGTIGVTGVATFGDVAADTLTVAGSSVAAQVQSDWNETVVSSKAYIRNKPDLTALTINELDDIGDVFVADAVFGDVLTYDGFSWQATAPDGGIALTDLSVTQNPASGTGSLVYNDLTGVFAYTPPLVPTQVSQLTNDSGYTTLAAVAALGYLQTGDVLNSGRITRSVASGQVTLGFDESGLYTTITTGANLTGVGTIASPLDIAASITVNTIDAIDGTTASTFKDITADNITAGLTLSSTNGNFTTTNGNITATNGNVTGNKLIATTEINASAIINTGGGITLTPNTNISLNGPVTASQSITFGSYAPGSPTPGMIWSDTYAVYFRSTDDGEGTGTDKTFVLGGPGTGVAGQPGMIIPQFESGDEPASPTTGEMYFDLGTSTARMWDGSTWRNLW